MVVAGTISSITFHSEARYTVVCSKSKEVLTFQSNGTQLIRKGCKQQNCMHQTDSKGGSYFQIKIFKTKVTTKVLTNPICLKQSRDLCKNHNFLYNLKT